jgi:hypothetical protein
LAHTGLVALALIQPHTSPNNSQSWPIACTAAAAAAAAAQTGWRQLTGRVLVGVPGGLHPCICVEQVCTAAVVCGMHAGDLTGHTL